MPSIYKEALIEQDRVSSRCLLQWCQSRRLEIGSLEELDSQLQQDVAWALKQEGSWIHIICYYVIYRFCIAHGVCFVLDYFVFCCVSWAMTFDFVPQMHCAVFQLIQFSNSNSNSTLRFEQLPPPPLPTISSSIPSTRKIWRSGEPNGLLHLILAQAFNKVSSTNVANVPIAASSRINRFWLYQ